MKYRAMTILIILLPLIVSCQDRASPTLSPLPMTTEEPVPTAEPTSYPTAVPTLASRPVWRLFFYGVSCPATAMCDVGLMEQPSLLHVVNSDGSGLQVPDISPAPGPRVIRSSADGARLAYRDGVDVVLQNPDGSNVIRFEDVPGMYFDFLWNDCIALYNYNSKNPQNRVTIKKICVGDTEPQILDTVEFPGQQRDYFRFYRISPQGDKLLAYVQNVNGGEVRLFGKELNSDKAPRLLFRSPSCEDGHQVIRPFRWNTDGETVELLWTNFCGDDVSGDQWKNVFYQINWHGGELRVRTSIQGISIDDGDWSPDGREFAFSYHPGDFRTPFNGEIAGVYILDLETGRWTQIVSETYPSQITTWRFITE